MQRLGLLAALHLLHGDVVLKDLTPLFAQTKGEVSVTQTSSLGHGHLRLTPHSSRPLRGLGQAACGVQPLNSNLAIT